MVQMKVEGKMETPVERGLEKGLPRATRVRVRTPGVQQRARPAPLHASLPDRTRTPRSIGP